MALPQLYISAITYVGIFEDSNIIDIRNIYGALKQIFETVATQSNKNFKGVVLFEYPRKDIWALGFVTTDAKGEVKHKVKTKSDDLLSVFVPTTPNPTSGFMLFFPRSDVIELDMSIEDAAKLVISAGLVYPPYKNSK